MTATILLYVIGATLAGVAYRRPGSVFARAMRLALVQIAQTFPRVLLVLAAAGFLAQIIPAELIGGWLDAGSGLGGIVLASVLGALIPSGPALAMPLAAVLVKAGAGTPQMVALITAWSIFAIHRILGQEVALVGWRFTLMRLASAGWAPIALGVGAGLMAGFGSA